MKHTADTITDDQLRTLRARLGSETYAGASDDALACEIARAAPLGSLRRVTARARCAELLNKIAQDRCVARKHDDHVRDVCEGQCCTSCGGPIDENEECRC